MMNKAHLTKFHKFRRCVALLICPELNEAKPSYTWATNFRPSWWYDLPVRNFIFSTHRKMLLKDVVRKGTGKFGARFPSQSAVQRMWQRIEEQNS